MARLHVLTTGRNANSPWSCTPRVPPVLQGAPLTPSAKEASKSALSPLPGAGSPVSVASGGGSNKDRELTRCASGGSPLAVSSSRSSGAGLAVLTPLSGASTSIRTSLSSSLVGSASGSATGRVSRRRAWEELARESHGLATRLENVLSRLTATQRTALNTP